MPQTTSRNTLPTDSSGGGLLALFRHERQANPAAVKRAVIARSAFSAIHVRDLTCSVAPMLI